MGADIFYRTKVVEDADLASSILEEIEENRLLSGVNCEITLYCSDDLEWANSEKCPNPVWAKSYIEKHIGRGSFKVSGLDEPIELLGIEYEEIFELLTVVFEKLNRAVEMKYLSGSCAFMGSYFSAQQIRRITDNGRLLSDVGHHNMEGLVSFNGFDD